jgi:hypothetical protein
VTGLCFRSMRGVPLVNSGCRRAAHDQGRSSVFRHPRLDPGSRLTLQSEQAGCRLKARMTVELSANDHLLSFPGKFTMLQSGH